MNFGKEKRSEGPRFLFLVAIMSLISGTLYSDALVDYLKQKTAHSEALLPTVVERRAISIRKEAFNRYKEAVYQTHGITRVQRENVISFVGEVAEDGNYKVWAFREKGFGGARWVHLVVSEGNLATPLKSIPMINIKWADISPGFSIDRPLVEFVPKLLQK